MTRDISAGVQFRQAQFDVEKLKKTIESGYMKQIRESKVTTKTTFAPSAIGGNYGGTCPRYWYMAFEGKYVFESDTDAMGSANMENGIHSHDRITKNFGMVDDFLIATEVEMLMKDPPIRGYIDALVRLDGETLVCEIKTTKQEMWIYRKNTMKPLAPHLYQILLYLRATGKKNGFLFYENKNDNTFIVIPVTMDEKNNKILDDALDWLRKVRANWELGGVSEDQTDSLPTRPWTRKSKVCSGCPLNRECWENAGDGTVTLSPMTVVKP